MEPVLVGNVYVNPNYYRVVSKVENGMVEYKFFNRIQYTYIPCGNRKKIPNISPDPIVVTCTLKFFVFDVADRKMTLCDVFHGKEPYFAPPQPIEDF